MGDTNRYHPILKAYPYDEVQGLFNPDANGFNADYNKTKAAIFASSDDHLKKELEIFRNFAESNRKLNLGEPFPLLDLPPIFYKSNYKTVKGGITDYVFKQTAMVLMMKVLPEKMFGAEARKVIEHCCLIFLKAKMEKNLRGQCEITYYMKADYTHLRKTLEKEYIKPGYKLKTQRPKQEEVIQELKKIVGIYDGVDTSTIDEKIAKFAEKQGIRDNAALVQNMLNAIAKILDEFNKFMILNNAFFNLVCDLPPHPKIRWPVRKFNDGPNIDFMFVQEFLEGYKTWGRDNEGFMNSLRPHLNYPGEKNNCGTIFWYDFCHTLPTHLKTDRHEIIFVDTPIVRTKKRAVYVPTLNGRHGILATDALIEFFRYLASVKQIFQVIDATNYDELFKIIFDCFKFVNTNWVGPMFVDVDKVSVCRKVCISKIDDKFKDLLSNVVDVRPIYDDGFTLEDMNREVEYLNLPFCFNNIRRYGKLIYDRLVLEKEPKELRLHDMYHALEDYQILSIVEKNLELYKWFRAQRATHHPPFCNIKFPEHPIIN